MAKQDEPSTLPDYPIPSPEHPEPDLPDFPIPHPDHPLPGQPEPQPPTPPFDPIDPDPAIPQPILLWAETFCFV